MPPAHARYAKKPRRAAPPEADAPRAPRRQAVLVGVGGAVSDGAGSVLGELRAHRDVQAIRALLVGASARAHVCVGECAEARGRRARLPAARCRCDAGRGWRQGAPAPDEGEHCACCDRDEEMDAERIGQVKQLKRMVRHSRAGDSYFFFCKSLRFCLQMIA
jgi:hypothetical protein